MKRLFFIAIILSSCVTNDKESSITFSYIKNSTPFKVKVSFFKDGNTKSYFSTEMNANSKQEVFYYNARGKTVGLSYNKIIQADDSIVFQFDTDTFLTHFNKQIDTTNKEGYSITNPNNILNPISFKLSKINETKRNATYEYVYEITNQDFFKARK